MCPAMEISHKGCGKAALCGDVLSARGELRSVVHVCLGQRNDLHQETPGAGGAVGGVELSLGKNHSELLTSS